MVVELIGFVASVVTILSLFKPKKLEIKLSKKRKMPITNLEVY